MNAADMTFGIELETTIPAGRVNVGPHGNGYAIPGLPGWKADSDPSIRARGDRQACEFVSPVFKGVDGLRQLLADVRAIKAMGAEVNASCGMHVHVGFDKSDAAAAAKLATLVSNFETAIYAATGTKNRERGRWCARVSQYGTAQRAITASRLDRYHLANFGTAKPTVEFRAFSGTLNEDKIVAYLRLCIGIVERALKAKRTTNWTAPAVKESSPVHRDGEGQTALARLFYQLGWTKGRQPHTHGDLSGESLPPIIRSKKALMKLARQYDARR